MRKILLALIGVAVVLGSLYWYRAITSEEKKSRPPVPENVAPVYVQEVNNEEVTISIEARGRIEPLRKIDLYSEVQGLFMSPTVFRPGIPFSRGQTVVQIDNAQEMANLKSQRANLLNLIVQMLPDIKYDFPQEYDKWKAYVQGYDIEASVKPLPTMKSERERYFVSGQNLTTTYYTIKEKEAQLEKFQITAPFTGILTEADVTPGALIRSGQKLGTLVSQSAFELLLSIPEQYAQDLKVGNSLQVQSQDLDLQLQGRITRINPTVDPSSQSIDAYVRIDNKKLREGLFMTARLELKPVAEAMRIDRKLLVDNQYVYGVEDSALVHYPVRPVHYEQETVVVQNLPDSGLILRRLLPSARTGMKVTIIEE